VCNLVVPRVKITEIDWVLRHAARCFAFPYPAHADRQHVEQRVRDEHSVASHRERVRLWWEVDNGTDGVACR
jgi:hypothetical protein